VFRIEKAASLYRSALRNALSFYETERDGGAFIKVRNTLRKLVGDADTNALLLATDAGTNQLASLGPLQGLTQLLHGEIDRATFTRQFGHHSPHLFEIMYPRPAEDPHWIDQQLAGLRDAPIDIMTLLARQQAAHAAATLGFPKWRRKNREGRLPRISSRKSNLQPASRKRP
jgi:pyruvate,water dikinase